MSDPTETPNPWEELQRLRKAVAMADVLDAWNADQETVEGLDAAAWNHVAALAEQKPPSDETKLLVVDLLASRARVRRLLSIPAL